MIHFTVGVSSISVNMWLSWNARIQRATRLKLFCFSASQKFSPFQGHFTPTSCTAVTLQHAKVLSFHLPYSNVHTQWSTNGVYYSKKAFLIYLHTPAAPGMKSQFHSKAPRRFTCSFAGCSVPSTLPPKTLLCFFVSSTRLVMQQFMKDPYHKNAIIFAGKGVS